MGRGEGSGLRHGKEKTGWTNRTSWTKLCGSGKKWSKVESRLVKWDKVEKR